MAEALLNTAKAAEFLGLGASTLEKYRLLGQGPRFCKLGSRVLYPTSSLSEWTTARLVSSTSEADQLRVRLAPTPAANKNPTQQPPTVTTPAAPWPDPTQPATTTPTGKRRGRPRKQLQAVRG